MTLIFEDSPYQHPLQTRDGMISGFADEISNLGAWKVLLIRPNWNILGQLLTILEQTIIENLPRLLQSCEEAAIVGVFFSAALRNQDINWQTRREAFRKIVLADKEFVYKPHESFGEFFTERLHATLTDKLADALAPFGDLTGLPAEALPTALAGLTITALGECVDENWYLIEPAQIISFRERKITEAQNDLGELQSSVELLLDRTSVRPYVRPNVRRKGARG